jgi:hypothetical protein
MDHPGAIGTDPGSIEIQLSPATQDEPEKKRKESADKPGSVEDNHSSGMRVAAHLKRPTRKPCGPHVRRIRGCSRALPYLVLLQAGFAVPSSVPTDAVRSYRTLSPLPAASNEAA